MQIDFSVIDVLDLSSSKAQLKTAVNELAAGSDSSLIWVDTGTSFQVCSKTREQNDSARNKRLKMSLPEGSSIFLKVTAGNINVTNLNAVIDGRIGKGNVSLYQTKGKTMFYIGKGNISMRQGEGEANLFTRNGNISLEDVAEGVYAQSDNGTVSRKHTKEFFLEKEKKPFISRFQNEQVSFENLPEGGSIVMQEGRLSVGSVSKNLDLRLVRTQAVVESADMAVTAECEESDVTLRLSQQAVANNERIHITSHKGNVTLSVPKNFKGKIVVSQHEDLDSSSPTSVPSLKLENDFSQEAKTAPGSSLVWPYVKETSSANRSGSGLARPVINEKGVTVGYHRQSEHTMGEGGKLISIVVRNGNVTIRKI